jgi:hypothetical protein
LLIFEYSKLSLILYETHLFNNCFFIFHVARLIAQNNSSQGWHLKDQKSTGYYGISLDQAYHFLKGRNLVSTPVIVAILDDGIDTGHEDLRNKLWVNSKEIPAMGLMMMPMDILMM